MRVGRLSLAGSRVRRLLVLTACCLAVPGTAAAQAPGAVTFSDAPDALTSSVSESFAFSAEGAADYTCSTDGQAFQACTDGTATVQGLIEGQHTFDVRAVDAAGALVAEGRVTWVVDLTKPVVTFDSGPLGPSRVGSAQVAFSSTDPTADFECSLDGGAFASCASSYTVDVKAGVTQELAVRATDAAGNVGEPAVRSWTGDGTAPKVTFTQLPAGVEGTQTFEFAFTVDDPTATVACTIDDVPIADCVAGKLVVAALPNAGGGTLLVRATDAAGNTSVQPPVQVDLEGPEVTISGKPANPTKSPTAGFVVKSEPDATLYCRLTTPGGADQFTECQTALPYTGLTSGLHTFEAQAIDAAGNAGPVASYAWRVDQEAPTVIFTAAPPAVATDATAELAFAASEEGSTLRCSVDGAAMAPCTAPVVLPNAVLGGHTFDVEATDPAGNVGLVARAAWTTSFVAAFDWAPAAAVIDQPVTFSSRAKGAIAGVAWDLDDDKEFDDGTGETAQRTFSEPGAYKVRLQVTHASGATKVAEADVSVGRTPLTTDPPVTPGQADRKPPVAAFTVAPQAPVAGQAVTLTSTSSDPDGTIASAAWDLDGDGQFDDASGASATRAFPAGTHVVGLQVVDADGLAATSFATVTVGAAPNAPRPPGQSGPKALTMLKPFPTVRVAGTAVGRRIRLRIFAVRAPRGTTVDVRCQGRGCPFRLDRHRVKGKARTVRVRRLEGRALRAGTVLEVRVHAPGRMGKYTRLFMRSGAAPKRTDACVSGTKSAKVSCPA